MTADPQISETAFHSNIYTKLASLGFASVIFGFGAAAIAGIFCIDELFKQAGPGIRTMFIVMFVLLALFCVPAGLALLWSAIQTLHSHLTIGDEGLTLSSIFCTRLFAWNELSIRRGSGVVDGEGWTIRAMEISKPHKQKVRVGNHVWSCAQLIVNDKNYRRIVELVEASVVQTQLPVTLQELDKGKEFDFGKLTVDRFGIRGKAFEANWEQIADFSDGFRPKFLGRGNYECRLILKNGKKHSFAEQTINNIVILKALVMRQCGESAILATF